MQLVSKLFRAYRLYNELIVNLEEDGLKGFQSSFELTGYITKALRKGYEACEKFQSSFELTGYITG